MSDLSIFAGDLQKCDNLGNAVNIHGETLCYCSKGIWFSSKKKTCKAFVNKAGTTPDLEGERLET